MQDQANESMILEMGFWPDEQDKLDQIRPTLAEFFGFVAHMASASGEGEKRVITFTPCVFSTGVYSVQATDFVAHSVDWILDHFRKEMSPERFRLELEKLKEVKSEKILTFYKEFCVSAARRGEMRSVDFGTTDSMGLTDDGMIEAIMAKYPNH